ncbi:TetR/AcrR family transcriptional regulator [Sphingomonas sp. OK281]|uniref:TetR/AcrR family transcriptional regulator n=1 Tax=Sphingomonas sp. OK281 TaxID=1881067 RepID=UPI001587AC8E|nr:TetR/AcrR family transcriptional regulator [Sphingomonas sp. OK281]
MSSRVLVEEAAVPRGDLAPRDWLEIGLQLLKDGGLRALKLRGLAQTLGASTGSFYHHFRDFDGYHAALAGYFVEAHIDPLIVSLSASDLSPVERIRAFADHVRDHDMAQLALAMRAWGKSDVRAAAAIRDHDDKVMAFLIAELAAHGFEPVEAGIRGYALLAIGLSQVHADEGIERSVLREGLLTLLCER